MISEEKGRKGIPIVKHFIDSQEASDRNEKTNLQSI